LPSGSFFLRSFEPWHAAHSSLAGSSSVLSASAAKQGEAGKKKRARAMRNEH
jgi:hypothetical protein